MDAKEFFATIELAKIYAKDGAFYTAADKLEAAAAVARTQGDLAADRIQT